MTKEVLITVSGTQVSPEKEENTIEVICPGEYHLKGGKHFLLYEETVEETAAVIKNIVRFAPGFMEVTKKGAVNAHMLFETGKEFTAPYQTPYGSILMTFLTESVITAEAPGEVGVTAVYRLKMNGEFTADCRLKIRIVPKAAGAMKL